MATRCILHKYNPSPRSEEAYHAKGKWFISGKLLMTEDKGCILYGIH